LVHLCSKERVVRTKVRGATYTIRNGAGDATPDLFHRLTARQMSKVASEMAMVSEGAHFLEGESESFGIFYREVFGADGSSLVICSPPAHEGDV
jgi:hypothetical protein